MTTTRVLGFIGIVGGAVLLVAFLPSLGIPPDFNTWRLVLFPAGAIAVPIAAFRFGALGSTAWSWLAAVAVIATNAAHIVFTIVGSGRGSPFGDFGLAWHWVAFAMWLSDGLLGLAILRAGGLTRWGAAALALGSPLAVLGMGRFELTSPSNPTIFGPIALIGVALNGVGWVLLGLDLVRPTKVEQAAVPGRTSTRPA